jgi:type III restriction enzyme
MSLHPDFSTSPYAPLIPEQRWFPADEALRSTAYEKLLTPLVAKVRQKFSHGETKNTQEHLPLQRKYHNARVYLSGTLLDFLEALFDPYRRTE